MVIQYITNLTVHKHFTFYNISIIVVHPWIINLPLVSIKANKVLLKTTIQYTQVTSLHKWTYPQYLGLHIASRAEFKHSMFLDARIHSNPTPAACQWCTTVTILCICIHSSTLVVILIWHQKQNWASIKLNPPTFLFKWFRSKA